MAQINEGDDMFYFKKQAMYSIGCLVLAIIVSYFDYHILAKFPLLIYGAAAFLMVLVKAPGSHLMGEKMAGAWGTVSARLQRLQ